MFKTEITITIKNILLIDVINAMLMLISDVFLLIGFINLNSLGSVEVASGNVDLVRWIFLIGSINCFVLLLFYIFCVLNWFALRTKGKLSIIAVLIYILGIYTKGKEVDEKAEEEKKSIGGEIFKSKSESASVESLYGFGHTEDEKWTFSGKNPNASNSI